MSVIAGEIEYEIESKIISLGDKTTIYDKNHNIIAYIEQEILHLMPHYNIYIENAGHLTLDDVIDKISDESEYTYGFSDDMTLADSKKTMLDTLQFATLGEYNCEIIAKDSFGNTAVKGFKVCIVEEGDKPVESGDGVDYSEYMNNNKIDNYEVDGSPLFCGMFSELLEILKDSDVDG